jgi:RHS repeat-associated protein
LEQHQYDGNGNRTSSTDANGNETEFTYDGANRLTARVDGLGSDEETRTKFEYDRVGNLLEEKDGRSTGKPFDVRNVYDDLNRLTSTEDAVGNVTTYEYDGEGNRTAVVEPKGPNFRTEYEYGERNELLEVRMADGGIYQYEYDPNLNRTEQTDAEGNVVTFTYDDLNRVDLMMQDPGGFSYVTDHDYDENGNEIQVTDPKGQVIDFDYDELNRLKFKVYNLTAGDLALYTRTHRIDYFYDPNDNLTRIDETKSSGTDPPAIVSSYKNYDTLDRLETETDAWGKTLTYDYDPQGNRTLLIDPDGKRTVYSFDELNRLETITLDEGTANQEVVTYDYFPDGLKKTVTNPNGTASTYLYDASDRMTRIAHTGPTGVISSYDYSYDDNGNRERQVETNAGRTETTDYTYDAVNRLKTVTYEVGTADATQVTYTYDEVGNRLTEQEVLLQTSTVTKNLVYTYDAINRLEGIDDLLGTDDVAYTYDPNGNTLTKAKGGVTTTFLYDIRNQLGEVQQGANVLGRYGYDSEGLRILKIGDDGVRRYTYDQLSVITEANQTNATVSKYDYGMDQLVRLDNQSEGRSFFHLDALGSTVNLTTEVGVARESIFYNGWGRERERVGSTTNRFTFTGYESDRETSLFYAKARFYDPDVGRFLSQDAFLGDVSEPPSLHRYFYALSNPLKFIDLTGFAGIQVTGHDVDRLYLDVQTGTIYLDLPTVAESVQVRAYSTPGAAVAAQLDLQLSRPVQRLEYPTSIALRSASVAGQTALAAGLAVAPEPASKAAAVYFAIRAVDEGQALVRELGTGQPTESEAHQGLRSVYQSAGVSRDSASTLAGFTLLAGDVAVGVGAIRSVPAAEDSLEGLGRSGQAPKPVNVGEAPTGNAAAPVPGQAASQRTTIIQHATGSPSAPNRGLAGSITDAEIDAAFEGAESRTMFQLPAQEPGTGQGLTGVELRSTPGAPIEWHDNLSFRGIEGAPVTSAGRGQVQVRTHGPNANAPVGTTSRTQPTTQISTPRNEYYMLPDGSWKARSAMTEADWQVVHIR